MMCLMPVGLDTYMPRATSDTTAKRIKEKIPNLQKFIFLATEGAINSKWCNWKLGFGDVKKYPFSIAILPIIDNRDNCWSGSEYLQTYPIITTDYNYHQGNYYVEFEGQKVNLVNWLKNQKDGRSKKTTFRVHSKCYNSNEHKFFSNQRNDNYNCICVNCNLCKHLQYCICFFGDCPYNSILVFRFLLFTART